MFFDNLYSRKTIISMRTEIVCLFIFVRIYKGMFFLRVFGQATKSLWWMAWRQEAMKDAVSSDMLRGGANSP